MALYHDRQRLLREIEAEVARDKAAKENPVSQDFQQSCDAQQTPQREIITRQVLLFPPRRSPRRCGAR
ncbi:MAG TPA: hypothetical protein VKE51_15520 [Vicinamibacterales bacterium]|nr:hypothetical protein [Vicinamibacterales bacterium]